MPNEEKQSFYSNTLDAVSSGDLQEVVNVAYEAIQRPIIITDPAYKVLAVQPNEKIGDDIYWDEQIEHGYTPIPLIISGHRNQFRQKALSGEDVYKRQSILKDKGYRLYHAERGPEKSIDSAGTLGNIGKAMDRAGKCRWL